MIKVTSVVNYVPTKEEELTIATIFRSLVQAIKRTEWVTADGTIQLLPTDPGYLGPLPGIGDKVIRYYNSEEEFVAYRNALFEAVPAMSVNTVLSIEEVID